MKKKLDTINPGSAYNEQYAGGGAGFLTVYLTAIFSLFKAWRFNNIPAWAFIAAITETQPIEVNGKKIPHLGFSDMFRGVHASAFRDSVQLGIYFAIFKILNDMIHNSIVAGMAGGAIGSLGSNPLAVIAMIQKIAYENKGIIETGKELYEEGGVKRFYRGFLGTTLARMTIQGAGIGGAISIAEKIHTHYNKTHGI